MQSMALFIVLVAYGTVVAEYRPPLMTILPDTKDVYFKARETVVIRCVADGIPAPIYRWLRNGLLFDPSGQDDRIGQFPNEGTLVFHRPEDKDEGIYQCFADNGYGVSASIKVNFREATLTNFRYEEKQTSIVSLGSALTLPCTPPRSIPHADIYWMLKEADGQIQNITLDGRVTMDLEGRLRFTNVVSSDEQGGKAYTCVASNSFSNATAVGPEHTIRVFGAAPRWKRHPEPLDKGIHDNATFYCEATGNPTPSYIWYINGIDFNNVNDHRFHNNKRIYKTGNQLTITNLTLDDHFNVQCNATNKHGYIFADAYLNVKAAASIPVG